MAIPGFVIMPVAGGKPMDVFDHEHNADNYVRKINKLAGREVARVVIVARNPSWSPNTAPGKLPDAVRIATGG